MAEATLSHEREDQASKEAEERAIRVAIEERKHEQKVRDKELREKDAKEAIEGRKAAMEMAKKNKIKSKS